MSRRRRHDFPSNSQEKENVKVTMLTCAAGPHGVARPGTVLNLKDDEAKELLDGKFARPFDHEKDRKAPTGFVTAPVDGQEYSAR